MSKSSEKYDDALFQESLRSILIAIDVQNPGKQSRAIVIASATPNEGKTIVALGLAATAALMGKRVLLVDSDLRKPSIHSYLGLDPSPGLTDLVQVRLHDNI
jgi:polysaccharide biosynthesis transport protein